MTGDKRYELSNHLGNVLVVINDKKIPEFEKPDMPETGLVAFNADVLSYSDYYPFGMLQEARHGSKANYRYGFQGQEMDNEIKGEGNSLNYTFRMHDPRVGRFFAVDPLVNKYPWYSPYQFAGNKVIQHVELEGLEEGIRLPVDGSMNLEALATDQSTEGKILRATLNGVHNLLSPSWWGNQAKHLVVQTWKWNGGSGPQGREEATQELIKSSEYITKIIQERDIEKITQFTVEFAGASIILKRAFKAPLLNKSSQLAREAVYNYAKEVVSERSVRNLPRSLSVVYDKVAKKYYYGESKGIKPGEKLTPELKKIMPDESKEIWAVENCSECHALNNAFKDGAKIENLEIHTVKLDKPSKGGNVTDFPPCKNCEITTKNINNTTNK